MSHQIVELNLHSVEVDVIFFLKIRQLLNCSNVFLVCLSFPHLSCVTFLTLMPCHCVQITQQTSGMLLL